MAPKSPLLRVRRFFREFFHLSFLSIMFSRDLTTPSACGSRPPPLTSPPERESGIFFLKSPLHVPFVPLPVQARSFVFDGQKIVTLPGFFLTFPVRKSVPLSQIHQHAPPSEGAPLRLGDS